MSDSCSTCIFWWDRGPERGRWFQDVDGLCRRHAPQGFQRGDVGGTFFPPMQSHMWCGDYQPDLRKVAAADALSPTTVPDRKVA